MNLNNIIMMKTLLDNPICTSDYLSKEMDISSRTVKRYIWELDDLLKSKGAHIISGKSGYQLIIDNEKVFQQYWKEQLYLQQEKSTDNEIAYEIIWQLMINKCISQDQLADRLFVSRSTVNKYMSEVKTLLLEKNIKINHKPHYGYYLNAEEKIIRNYMVKNFFNGEMDSRYKDELLNQISGDFSTFYDHVIQILAKYSVQEFDTYIQYYMRYLYVIILRILRGCEIEYIEEDNGFLIKEDSLEEEIILLIKKYFHIDVSENEKRYLCYITGNYDRNEIKEDCLILPYESIVDEFLLKIKNTYQQDFTDDYALKNGLIQHLYRSYSRMYVNAVIVNPIISYIKTQYSEAFNYAVLCCEVLKDNYHIKANEYDMGYIALYFAAAIERAEELCKHKALIVCGSGYGTAELLKTKLLNKIRNIDIIDTISSNNLAVADLSEVKLIITTVPIVEDMAVPVITVSSLLLEKDILKIKEYLAVYRHISYLKKLFNSELFFPQLEVDSKEELLKFVGEKLVSSNKLNDIQLQSLMEREKASGTEINEMVAMPHCISSGDETFFAVITLQKKINWGRSNIRLVFLGSIGSAGVTNHKIFPLLYKLTMDNEKVKELCKIDDFDIFIDKLFNQLPVDSD